jgi:hypothetical protein
MNAQSPALNAIIEIIIIIIIFSFARLSDFRAHIVNY